MFIDVTLLIGCPARGNGQQSRSRSAGARSCTRQDERTGQRNGCQVETTSVTIRVALSLPSAVCLVLIRADCSYREQVEKVTRLRDDTVRAIIKNSHDIAVFKEEVSQQLKHVREFAEEN
jgi:kinetochore protein NDC80